MALNRTGEYLATGSKDRTARVWDSHGKELAQITHQKPVRLIALSPDGRLVVTFDDGPIRVWEVAGRQEIARVNHDGHLSIVAFSPDGKYLATGGSSAVRVWLWRREDLIAEVCACLTRNLTPQEWQQYLSDEPYRKICPDLP